MAASSFQNVIVIGYGAIAYNALRLCHEKASQYKYRLMYLEHEIYPFNAAKHYATSNEIPFAVLEKKEDVLDCLMEKAGQKTLIISASNNYLFPECIVEKSKATIINFHNALLPKYPGRNAVSWAIYSAETETGITWHYVFAGIDDGDIILQKSCPITENVKAYELTEMLMDLAAEGLVECLDSVLQETVQAKKQPAIKERKLYRSTDIPGEGIIHMDDNPEYIYRILRAMDYGYYRIFPAPKMIYEGQEVSIIGYEIVETGDSSTQNSVVCLPFSDSKNLLLKYTP